MRSILAPTLLFLTLLLGACAEGAGEGVPSASAGSFAPAAGQGVAGDAREAGSGAITEGGAAAESEPAAAAAAEEEAGSAAEGLEFAPRGPIPDEDLGEYLVEMRCSIGGEDAGTMVFEFWPEKAPVTARNFLRYASEGLYDGRTFHRIIKGFMIQGGCPNGDGTGTGRYGTIPGEMSSDPRYHHFPGVLSMARGRSLDSGSCQFFVCNDRASSLDGKYASFGKLVSGMETLTAISDVPCVSNGRDRQPSQPIKKVIMESVRVVRKEQQKEQG